MPERVFATDQSLICQQAAVGDYQSNTLVSYMQKIIGLFTLLILFVAQTPFSQPADAQQAPRVFINGQLLASSFLPFTQQSTLYVPIQLIENLGFQVHLDPVKRSARLIQPGRFFVLKAGSKVISWKEQGMQISQAPIWQDNTLFVPRSLFVNLGVLMSYSAYTNEFKLTANLNQLENVQLYPNKVYSRLVFRFAQQPVYTVQESEQRLIIDLKGVDPENLATLDTNFKDAALAGLEIKKTGPGTARITINKAYPMPHKIYWLSDPHRLMVDLVRIFQEQKQSQVAPGVQLENTYQGFDFGPVRYFALTISPQARVKLVPALAGSERSFSKAAVSQISQRYGAIAAINASYFNRDGYTLGLFMKNRELISSPIYGRTFLGIDQKQTLFVDDTSRSLSVFFSQEKYNLAFNSVNLPRQDQQLVLYTPRFGQRTGTSANDSLELQVQLDGTVSAIGSNNMEIPADGFVISAQGGASRWLRANAYEGMQALVFSKLWEQWAHLEHAISGGPRLLKRGQVAVNATEEKFQADIAVGRAPRTALGIKANGEIIMLVVDGRTSRSKGLTLTELAQLLKEKGAVEALNFDGGGSTAMVIKGKVINTPSDGSERAVGSALLVMPE